MILYGRDGQIRLPDPYESDPLQIYLKRAVGEFTPEQWHTISTGSVFVYQRAIDDFAQAVQMKQCVPINAHAARRVLAIVLAIYRSALEQRTISIS